MAAPANRPAARVAIISSNICAESFLSSSRGDHKVAATATATNDATASIERPRCPRNQRARISSIAFASAGGVATMRRWSGTRIAIDAASVTTKPAAPTSASTRAEPPALRANPAAETIAAGASDDAHDLVEGGVVGRRARRHHLELGTRNSGLEVLRGLPLGDIHEAKP